VRKQEFRRAVRGFDCEEVRAFLTTVADEYEAVLIDNKQLRERILEQDQKIVEYRDMEKIGAYASKWNFIVSRDGHGGVSPRELQRVGRTENGSRTDLAQRFPRVAGELAAYLEQWERAHPKARPTLRRGALSPDEDGQLRALGYLP